MRLLASFGVLSGLDPETGLKPGLEADCWVFMMDVVEEAISVVFLLSLCDRSHHMRNIYLHILSNAISKA